MSLGAIRTDSGLARAVLIAAGVLCLALAFVFAKWHFANASSSRVEQKELADLMIELGPSDPQTHFAAAVLREQTFEPADAARSLAAYESAASLAPNNYLVWVALARARSQNGDDAGAEAAFRRATELAPSYSDVQWAFGNWLIRAGRADEGFALLRTAAIGRPEYMPPAAVTAMSLFDGDPARVRQRLGDTSAVNAALAAYFLSNKKFDEAVESWGRVDAVDRRGVYKQAGDQLAAQLAAAFRYRLASSVMAGMTDDGAPTPGILCNGGFESGIKLRDQRLFDWQIGSGTEPQIGLNETQKRTGGFSLFLIFNTMQAADMRQIAQTIAVESGAAYIFEGYYRSELKGSLAWEIVNAADGKSLARTSTIGTAADWTQFRAEFTVPPTSDGVTVRLVRDGCTSSVCPISGRLWLDDLSITKK
ncbi:MAG: hypothetical protein KA746_15455 [Pyrinomonadaceae bacterium]|nr:hypothetical protein [Pyrinomonadaceae bacterium]MBP6214051.1 hypothetical protein [Pyrinomonadaceae bacterium]